METNVINATEEFLRNQITELQAEGHEEKRKGGDPLPPRV